MNPVRERLMDVARMFKAAASEIEQHGVAEPGVDVDLDGRLSIDAACRRVEGLPEYTAYLTQGDANDDWRRARNDQIAEELRKILPCPLAKWAGGKEETVALLRWAAIYRRAQAGQQDEAVAA